jgi:Cof subfamily protein (haloacid dehalogenase superfamily)
MSATIRLVVSDVDGTLVDDEKRVTPATVAAVRRLREAGIGFTIVSARPMSGMRWIADLLEIEGAMGAFNGGTVFRRDGSVERRALVPADVARGVLALVGDAAETWVFADDQWYATDGSAPHTASERKASSQEPEVRHDFGDLMDRCDKLTFVSDDAAALHALSERAKAAFGDRATIAQSQTYYLDVTAVAANKGDGITGLAEAAGVPLDQVCAIGDQANDLPMLGLAGLAVAMGQAPDAVKEAADAVTGANTEDGVAQAIDRLVLARD